MSTLQTQPDAAPRALRIAMSRGEALLLLVLLLLGMGLWVAADYLVTSYTKYYEPREEQYQIERELPRLQASLAMTQDERKSTQDLLIKSRLELAEREAAVKALDTFPPPAEVRAEALRQRVAAAQLVNSLIGRLDVLQNVADELNAEAQNRQRRVAGELYRSRWNFRMFKAASTLVLAVSALFLLLWFVSRLRRSKSLKGKVPGLSADGSLMWWMVVGLVVVLFGYQAFETAGAAVAGVAVLLIFLARVPWSAPVTTADAQVAADAGTGEGA